MKALFEACQSYFSDGGSDAVRTVEYLEEYSTTDVTVRVAFNDEHVSDWKLLLDEEDGTVLYAYCFNDVM